MLVMLKIKTNEKSQLEEDTYNALRREKESPVGFVLHSKVFPAILVRDIFLTIFYRYTVL